MEIVQFVFYFFLHFLRVGNTSHAVEKLFAVDAHMLLYMIIKVIKLIIKSVHFVELQNLLKRR